MSYTKTNSAYSINVIFINTLNNEMVKDIETNLNYTNDLSSRKDWQKW
jgi:hypothetical protein